MTYRPGTGVLHLARVGITSAYCAALVALALCFSHPLVIAAVAAATFLAAALSGVLAPLLRVARFAVPLAIVFALINALVVRDGLTVIWRFGEVPPFGQIDITLEALGYGLLLGLRMAVVVLACALLTLTVDPDQVLRSVRRWSFRSALTAALALRLVPVLARDAQRLDLARRCRPDLGGSGPRARLAVVRAISAGALDRAVDVAATLELRGCARPVRQPRATGLAVRPWSRQDIGVLAAAIGLVVVGAWGLAAGVASIDPYPRLSMPVGGDEVILAVAIVVIALLPFAGRQGSAAP